VLGKQGEHVVEKWNAGFDPGPALAVQIQPQGNPGFERVPFKGGLPFHAEIKPDPGGKNQGNCRVKRAA
jgi:hypothetical protein